MNSFQRSIQACEGTHKASNLRKSSNSRHPHKHAKGTGSNASEEQQTAPESTTATSVGQFIFTALPQVGGIVPVGRSVSISGVGVRVSQTPLTRK